ncbi:MAG TPA: O-antigen ligase family protein [Gaiellaceae bacterium]|nr:O-antigen ligase family protein [Gaiellaceae bacterium]
MADAAAPAVRARAASLDFGPLAVGLAAAAGLGALAAADGGYFPPSWGWTALVGLWVAAAWLLLDRAELAGGALGSAFLAGVAGIAGWTWLSLLWTENTVQTVVEGFRVLAYVGVAAALLFLVRRATAPALIRGTFAAITLVSLYALATRLFPDRLGTYDPVAEYRLSEPLGYWNGLGIFAAMGTLLALGILARDSSLLSRSLAAAAFPALVCTIFFTFSRGAWIALGLGFLFAFALDPRRLHLVVAAIAVGVPTAFAVWASWEAEALTTRNSPLSAAVDQGRVVALIVAVCAVAAAAAVAALALAESRIQPARSLRLAFATLLALVAVGAAGGVLVNFGGPVALVEDTYDAFRTPPQSPTRLERRLFTFSGAYRAENWEAAWDDFRANPVAGSGAGTYEQYWNRNRPISHVVRDAHSLYLETLAELGVVGFFLVLVTLGAPVVAAFGARREPLAIGAAGAYAAYVLHAAVDWDWELTGLTTAALACGVALLALRRGRAALLVPGGGLRIAGAALAIALAAVAFVGLVGSSASSASQEALESSPPDYGEAKEQARKAERWAPWSSEPWRRLGEAQLADGEAAAARTSFRNAIAEEPTDWELWFRLAEASGGAARQRALAQALRLNPRSPELATFRAEGG